jgi:cytoskeleton protein RodZ
MNAAEEADDIAAESQPKGPGERLKSAREAAGLELERVADRLHLKVTQVEALERDSYDDFAARVFVRGYLRNYARLVNLPVDSVLATFDAVYPDPDRPLQLKPVGSHKPQVSSRHGVVRLISWLLLLAVIGLFLVWWAGYLELNGDDVGGQVSSPVSEPAAPDEAGLPAMPEGELTLPPVPAAEPPPDQPSDQPADQPPVTEQSAPPVPAVDQPVDEPPAPANLAAAPTADTEVEPQRSPPPAPGAAAVSPAQVVLSLVGPCWVEIRDSSNSFRLIGAFEAGTRRVLEGQPPYRILLGNAPMARLTVGGEPVDLAPFMRGQVARLTLDPGAR